MPSSLKIIIISDTHGLHELLTIPDGDILIHAGDMTEYGELDEIKAFDDWLGTLPHKHKIVIAGNHEHCLEENDGHLLFKNAIYLQHEAVTIEGIRFFGSPYQPYFHNMAFNLRRGQDLTEKWQEIPPDTDILITHTPPFKYLDRVRSQWVGCEDLLKRVQDIKPKLHIFGHIHENYGQEANRYTLFVNACSVLELDAPFNKPMILNWPL